MFLIGAPCSRMLDSSKATPPPRLDSCSAELMERPIDSMLSSMRSRKQLTGSPRCFPGGRPQRAHAHAVLETVEVTLAVESLQRVRGVVLERPEEGREAKLLGIGPVQQRLHEVARVLVEHLTLVVV